MGLPRFKLPGLYRSSPGVFVEPPLNSTRVPIQIRAEMAVYIHRPDNLLTPLYVFFSISMPAKNINLSVSHTTYYYDTRAGRRLFAVGLYIKNIFLCIESVGNCDPDMFTSQIALTA